MAINSKAEARALTSEENDLVDQTRHPALQDLSDSDIGKLVALLRERRNRAQSQANQQRREMRRKSEPKGAAPAAGDTGNRLKTQVLAKAMARLNSESTRRKQLAARIDLRASARKALEMKKEAEKDESAYNTRHAHDGMRAIKSQKRQDLIRPMERGRQRKAGAVAQARRDARQAEA